MFGAGAYATLTDLAHRANDPATYRDTPHDLPLLFVSGDADPVGKCGRAVAAAFGHELGADPVSDEALEALLTASDGEA